MDKRAEQFLNRAKDAENRGNADNRLLCLFNALYTLQKNEAYATISKITDNTEETVKKALNSCLEDYEGERTQLKKEDLDKIQAYLESLQ